MIRHVSFATEDPERAAKAVAELWGGEALYGEFPVKARVSRNVLRGEDRLWAHEGGWMGRSRRKGPCVRFRPRLEVRPLRRGARPQGAGGGAMLKKDKMRRPRQERSDRLR